MLEQISSYIFPDKNDIIFNICKTTKVKKILNSLLIIIIAIILRLLLYSILSFAFTFVFNNDYIDFCVQCLLSIILCIYNPIIQDKLEYFEPQFYKLTRYVVNNYSNDKFKKWKTYAIFTSLFIGYMYFTFVDITSALIRLYLIQYAICYLFLEIYNNYHGLKNMNIEIPYIRKKNIINDDDIIIDKSMYEPGIDGFVDINVIKIDKGKNIDNKKNILYTSISDEYIIVDK
ncbi:hypothetical protein BMW23_0752 [Bodo saltans virus]|uniref:Uncharacterized protein n=1 Tax=Bodo saltans virus TaxID=2024608 RepID=A0A2H4UV49_9VIRU|nr:hypothetical protein QJ851_gp0735 [Bodo saltans virus]ATZ80798.1 hypothetical protein BMW23_0752 [Bodo saltans virus]